MEIILTPFAWLLRFFYSLCGSYGLTLVLFALVVKVVLFPLSLKGKRSMIQMNILQGQMQKLQKQYGKDRQRYNLEVQKLYEKEKVNPMGGCLWSFIPLIILMVLYPIIRAPIHYMMGITDPNSLNAIAEAVNWSTQAVDMGWIKQAAASFTETAGYYNELYLASLINADNLAAVQQAVTAAGGVGANVFSINFSLFGLVDLSQIPQLQFWTITGGLGLFLLPVISAVTGVFFSFISMKTNAINKQSAQNNSSAKTMMIVSPLISLWIGFTLPAALCVYWIANNLLSMLQEFLCSRILKKDYEEAARKQAERELQEKEEEKEERRRKAEERARRIEEEKLNRGKKKKAEKKHEDEEKIPGIVKEYSRVGIRQYARGRAYDPYRYSEDGPTCYPGEEPIFGRKQDKAAPVEEEVVTDAPAVCIAPETGESADGAAPADTAVDNGETKE
ncbi:insertase [Flavonifractor sp. An82]|uniref:YidC/Oxa1 family membrane protein insertase n=1 Tax=Flavonifractor sp. An82 TaxID=1965660 RepID=UPI000B3A8A4A|nr:YidC/Oxa1 family membrane protein insertase [Flavonifractor sp. An82]OUN22871.1 insertase [Flavonifractor sp. An82]